MLRVESRRRSLLGKGGIRDFKSLFSNWLRGLGKRRRIYSHVGPKIGGKRTY